MICELMNPVVSKFNLSVLFIVNSANGSCKSS